MTPVTLAGQMVSAMALQDVKTIQELDRSLRESSWTGAGPVFEIAFRLAITYRFSADEDVREISRWVLATVTGFEARHLSPVVEAEALIRRALGEDVDVSEIPGSTVATIRFLVIAAIAKEMNWSRENADELGAEAEAEAIDRGARPEAAGRDH